MTLALNASRARSFAETLWGRGGTTPYRTDRRGFWYYSCAGHGGYVVDGRALTDDERAEIDKCVKPDIVWVLWRDGRAVKVSNPHTMRRQRFYARVTDTLDKAYPVYFFEEDCDWSVVEHITGVRSKATCEWAQTPEYVEQAFDSRNALVAKHEAMRREREKVTS